jgi:hypothetical protein
MKHSDILVKNGIIYNEITDVIAKLKLQKGDKTALVICLDDEIFDQAMQTVANRFPQNSVGTLTAPSPGTKMGERRTTIKIVDNLKPQIITLDVMIDEVYQANKAAVDAKTFNLKKTITWTGGEN